ncbi:MAG: RraA family protein [Acidimicrobiales bacterium]|nr:RraA family protein [Acidimicrobiales bacterium]
MNGAPGAGAAGATLLERLTRLDSCAVSDALDRLGLAGVVTGLAPLSVPDRRVVGTVITVELGPAPGATNPNPNPNPDPNPNAIPNANPNPNATPIPAPSRHLGTAAVDAARPGDVIVVAHQGRVDCAGWGGILSLAAQLRGVAGVIVDGACRDLDEARQLGFPVFAAAAVPTTARNRAVERAWGEPITLGRALRVRRGDLVVADASGVAFIGAERAAEVIDAAEDIFGREAAMAAALRAGGRASEVMGRSYEELVHDRKGAQPWR